jgi:TolA-binding protein
LYAEAHHSLGQALARQGKVEEAAYHYQQALRILKEGQAAASATDRIFSDPTSIDK